MVKCGSLLQVDNENEESTNILDFDSDDDESDNIDVTCDTIFDDPKFDDCMTSHFNSLAVIRCAAHTIQLSVYDVIKNENVKLKFEKCRLTAKKLRTSTSGQ
ncbi:PREDICTED: uncharacterized protein LOC108364960 isoform X2 [Rhagoletis zephyria]|uniref:uncharacterized protein LOC108364960 isoform X2 n=1 Tax=Rhagoletis zephyria TaxID=28612 RepID=UPI00081190EF|nr:PREDICTED: uncharacterized protein LOC108364960 isoform X2 [Rhagoletis zephyria]